MGLISAVMAAVRLDVPVDPDSAQARQWIIDELAKPQYRAAEPTWFDRLSTAFLDWLQSLKIGSGPGIQGPILLLVALVVIAALIAAWVIFGAPRFNRRSSLAGSLFGEDDQRDAAAMRSAAASAASRGDWTVAIEEMFRALARGLAERTILTVTPGTTARDFSARAAVALPAFTDRLASAASDFDDVRYLDRTGTEPAYRSIASLEQDLRAARPILVPVSAPS